MDGMTMVSKKDFTRLTPFLWELPREFRKPQGKRWPTAVVLLFALLAKLAGQDSARSIASWINLRIQTLNQALDQPAYSNRQGVVSGPHATTYGRVMGQTVNRHALNVVVQGYFGSQA